MKIFIWEYLDNLTTNYHSGGGLVVIANSIESAKELIFKETAMGSDFNDEPDLTYDVISEEEKILVFPDAGCC